MTGALTTVLVILLAPLTLIGLAALIAAIRSATGPCTVRSRHDRLRVLRATRSGRASPEYAEALARRL